MRFLIPVLVAFLSAAASAEQLAFKGLALGTDEAEVLKFYPNARCSGDTSRRSCVLGFVDTASKLRKADGSLDTDAAIKLRASMSVGGASVTRILFVLREGRLESILLFPLAAGFDSMAAAFTEKYGKPTADEIVPLQNRAGARFENRKMAWAFDDGMIRVARYSSDLDESTVGYHSAAALRRIAGDAEDARKRAAKDL